MLLPNQNQQPEPYSYAPFEEITYPYSGFSQAQTNVDYSLPQNQYHTYSHNNQDPILQQYETVECPPPTIEELWLYDRSATNNDSSTVKSTVSTIFNVVNNNLPVRKIQTISCFINGLVANLSLDSGCEADCIQEKECLRLGIKIMKLDENDKDLPTQADGQSSLQIIGKASFTAWHNTSAPS